MFVNIVQNLWLNYLAKISKTVVYGIENIPKNTNFVVAFNHDGYFDLEFVIYAFKDFKMHFFYDMPNDFGKYFLKWWYDAKGLGVTFVPSKKKDINRKALNNAVIYLNKNKNIGIAPQGPKSERFIESKKRKFYPGCAIISCKSNKPIMPVRILNDETYLYGKKYFNPLKVISSTIRKLKNNVKNGKNVVVLIGKPLYPDIEKYNHNQREYVEKYTQII